MGFFRNAMGLFRGRTRKNRKDPAAEVVTEQARTVTAQPEAEFVNEQTRTVSARPEAARREVKYEARPNPDKPGWGRSIDLGIGKFQQDRASQE